MACLAISPALSSSAETGPGKRMTLGVFPFLQTARLEKLFAPTASRLGELIDTPISVRSSPSMRRFRERIRQQHYDLIFIQPFDYTRFAASAGYIPLARWTFRGTRDHPGELNALFVVREDSPIHSLDDLPGKKIVAPPEESAVAILGMLDLRKRFPGRNIPVEFRPDHLSCLQQLASGNADVCICAAPPLMMFQKKHGMSLRTIHMSQWIPSSLYAVHRRVPEAQRESMRKALLSWRVERDTDRQCLFNGMWSRLHPASDALYAPVRALWETYSSTQ